MMTFICALGAWLFIALLLTQAIQSFNQGQNHLRRLHQIPCHHCQFHTHCTVLKCTVHPYKAFGEDAISCQDFELSYGAMQNL